MECSQSLHHRFLSSPPFLPPLHLASLPSHPRYQGSRYHLSPWTLIEVQFCSSLLSQQSFSPSQRHLEKIQAVVVLHGIMFRSSRSPTLLRSVLHSVGAANGDGKGVREGLHTNRVVRGQRAEYYMPRGVYGRTLLKLRREVSRVQSLPVVKLS